MKKDKKGLYSMQVTIDGKRKVFRSKNKQELALKVIEYTKQKKSPTFGLVAEQWHDKHFDEIRYGTGRCYEAPYKRVVEEFGNLPLDKITPKGIQLFLQSQGTQYAKKTVSNTKTVINSIFKYAIVELGLDISNPCALVQLPRNLRSSSREPLSPEQLQEVLNTKPNEFILAPLILYTGTRCGEAIALQWKDIDWKNNTISITKDIDHQGNRPRLDSLKTKNSIRTIPLLPQLKTLLKTQISPLTDDFIVSGSEPLTKSQLRCRWKAWCKDHGLLEDGKPTIDRHQIRHQYATLLYEAGIEAKDAQSLLGHSDISTTMNIYTHISEQRQKITAEKLANYLESAHQGTHQG